MDFAALAELAKQYGPNGLALYVIYHLVVKLLEMMEKSTSAITASEAWFKAMTTKIEGVEKKIDDVKDDVRRNECKAVCPVVHQQRPSGQGAMG